MAEFPGLTLWTDSYLADTRHLSTEEHGAYLLLLMEAWRRPGCDLPDDDAELARMSGLPLDRWVEIKPRILAFWKLDKRSRKLTQKRLNVERRYMMDRRAMQRDKAAKRWKKTENDDAAAKPRQCRGNAPTPTPTPTPTPKNKRETDVSLLRDRPAKPDPLARFEEFWDAYPHRGGAKKGKAAAIKAWARAIKSGADPEAILVGAAAYHRDAMVLRGFAKDPATWLNQQGWTDEIEPPDGPERMNGHHEIRQETPEEYEARMSELKARMLRHRQTH